MNETLNPGKYYLGDPNLVLHDKIIFLIWGSTHNYSDGKFNVNGTECVMHTTHKGDDTFIDTKNRKYIVSSGVLSLVNVELIEDIDLAKKYGHIFNFEKKVNFIYDAGLFYIKSGKKFITIDTRDMDEYDSEYEEHCENEDGEYISKTINNDSDNDDIDSVDNDASSDNEEESCEKEETKQTFSFFKKRA